MITNAIQYWYYNHDRLFIGAAGTSPSWFPTKRVVFPASLPEVVAVTGVVPMEGVGDKNHYGPKVELAAVVRMPTEANRFVGDGGLAVTDNSSNATAIISGIAALTWAYYPWMTRDQVRMQLRRAGAGYDSNGQPILVRDGAGKEIGFGVVNAHKALGGMYTASLDGPVLIAPQSGYEPITRRYYLYKEGGDGPFEYHRLNGSSSEPYIDVTFYPERDAYTVQVAGYIRDRSDGTSIFKSMYVRVEPPIDDRVGCPSCMQ